VSALSRTLPMNRRIVTWLIVFVVALVALVAACDRGTPPNPTEVPGGWATARKADGHVAHLGKQFKDNTGTTRAIACGDCHEEQGDAIKSPGTKPCKNCHEENVTSQHHKGSAEKQTTCVTCHVFVGQDGGVSPKCLDCHEKDPGTKTKVAHHATPAANCSSCHAPHRGPAAALADCRSCHTGIGASHGSWSVPAVTPDAGDAMADVDDALALRAEALASAPFDPDGGVAPVGDAAAMTATSPGLCATCHTPHSAAKDARTVCVNCHVAGAPTGGSPAWLVAGAPKVRPSGPKVAGHEACTTCHMPHDAREASVKSCAGCHAPRIGIAAVKGHGMCVGCHTPHAPSNAPASCTGCHKLKTALAASKVPAHNNCASCHDVHTPKNSPVDACTRCHTAIKPSHPQAKSAKGVLNSCTGCHTPHPTGTTATVATCTSCHTKVANNDHKLHTGIACASCHKKHEFKLAGAGAAFCGTCHGPIAAKVAKPGHADCTKCHGAPHTPTKDIACSKCHAVQASTAPKGHAVCGSCHDSHSGKFVASKPVTAATLCATCHQEKPAAVHGSIPTGCATCHRAHGPKGPASPPACASCHTVSKLPGLHAAPSHAANCSSCHSAHQPPKFDRATCTSTCHAKQKTHQPETNICRGCHIFRKASSY